MSPEGRRIQGYGGRIVIRKMQIPGNIGGREWYGGGTTDIRMNGR